MGEELVDSDLVKYREEVAWTDINGNVCAEKDAYGCKVDINITDLDWVLMMDKISGNTN